jgi:hypothetical protein
MVVPHYCSRYLSWQLETKSLPFPQMLVFYTWAVRLLADTVSLFAATEDIGWLAEETPQEGAALILGGGSDGKDGGSDIINGKDTAKKLSLLSQKSFSKEKKTATKNGQWPTNGVLPITILA